MLSNLSTRSPQKPTDNKYRSYADKSAKANIL